MDEDASNRLLLKAPLSVPQSASPKYEVWTKLEQTNLWATIQSLCVELQPNVHSLWLDQIKWAIFVCVYVLLLILSPGNKPTDIYQEAIPNWCSVRDHCPVTQNDLCWCSQTVELIFLHGVFFPLWQAWYFKASHVNTNCFVCFKKSDCYLYLYWHSPWRLTPFK